MVHCVGITPDALERVAALDADHGEYGVRPGGRVRAVRVDPVSEYRYPDRVDRCRECVEELERGGNPTVDYGHKAVNVEEREFPWSFTLLLPGRDPKRYGVSAHGVIVALSDRLSDPQDPVESLSEWVTDLSALDCMEVAARGVALSRAREHLEYREREEQRKREADGE